MLYFRDVAIPVLAKNVPLLFAVVIKSSFLQLFVPAGAVFAFLLLLLLLLLLLPFLRLLWLFFVAVAVSVAFLLLLLSMSLLP